MLLYGRTKKKWWLLDLDIRKCPGYGNLKVIYVVCARFFFHLRPFHEMLRNMVRTRGGGPSNMDRVRPTAFMRRKHGGPSNLVANEKKWKLMMKVI